MPEYKKKNKVNELYKEKPSVNDKERVSNFKISFQYLDTAYAFYIPQLDAAVYRKHNTSIFSAMSLRLL